MENELNMLKKEIPFKWKIQSLNKAKTKASCVAYIDARDVMDILDDAVWPENWQDNYKKIDNELMAWIWIKINDEWIRKWDVWTRQENKGYNSDIIWKAEVSDAFKRAWVKWGIWRFLYNQNIIWVWVDQYKNPIDKDWKKVLLNEYCNKLNEYFNSKK